VILTASLQRASWEQAMSGDLGAVKVVLRILHLRAKILGLYSHTDGNCAHVTEPVILW
jgi:hypothetical protein